MDTVTRQFEGWWEAQPFKNQKMFKAAALKVWKDSREALCIEIPEVRVLDGGVLAEIGYEMAINDFEKSLDMAGVSYK